MHIIVSGIQSGNSGIKLVHTALAHIVVRNKSSYPGRLWMYHKYYVTLCRARYPWTVMKR
uniref:Uncharacterized protein n=1 Tax=Arundo donax TaxID=35708 RepID=A0A0A9GQL2_ARUDO